MGEVPIAAAAFVGTHFLLSHPLRAPIVSRLGERGFLGVYSLVAAVTLGWLVFAYRAAPLAAPLWPVGDTLWAVATAMMLLASVLFMGSLVGNPALPDPGGQQRPPVEPRGVFAITRHPMMWSFALWGAAHILVYPQPANIVLAGAIVVLALVGYFFFGIDPSTTTSVVNSVAPAGQQQEGTRGAPTDEGGRFVDVISTNVEFDSPRVAMYPATY